jgi:hypothetical protein
LRRFKKLWLKKERGCRPSGSPYTTLHTSLGEGIKAGGSKQTRVVEFCSAAALLKKKGL